MNQPTSASLGTMLLIQAERIKLADPGLIQAKEAIRIDQERDAIGFSQSAGASPQLELSSAQAALTLASTNRVNPWINLLLAQTKLNHAECRFGRPLDAKGHPPTNPWSFP